MEEPSKLTNKARLEKIEGRLTEIEQALGLRAPEPKKPLWERGFEKLVNHKGLAIILCLFALVAGYWLNHHTEWTNTEIDGRVDEVLKKPEGVLARLSHINDTVVETDSRLKTLEPFIHDVVTRQFENVSKLPTAMLQKRLPAINDLLAVARDQKVQVDPALLVALAKKLAPAAPKDDDAWITFQSLISYKSFLIGMDVPQFTRTELTQALQPQHYALVIAPTPQNPKALMRAVVDVSNELASSPDNSARLSQLGAKPDSGIGPKWIVVDDPIDEIVLDNIDAKNVIFRNVTFYYTAKPLRLENVFFQNCQFKSFPNNEVGRQVLTAIGNQPTSIKIKKPV